MSTATPESALRTFYRQEFERVRREFDASGSGRTAIGERTELVDRLALHLWDQYIAGRAPEGCVLTAIGGFGREALFPHSDIDLLFLCESEAVRSSLKDAIRNVCQEMWDTGLRVSPTTRTLDDCSRFDQDNIEFTISLLDSRLLSGDKKLFGRLRDKNLPQLITRESGVLTQRLAEVTRTRHLRYGNTIFHLEPNLKDGPGGLRDAHVSRWLAVISALVSQHKWPESLNPHVHIDTDGVLEAMEFLSLALFFALSRRSRR